MTLEIGLYYNTQLGAVIDRNNNARCIPICIAIQVVHIEIYIAIRSLAYRCDPSHSFHLCIHAAMLAAGHIVQT